MAIDPIALTRQLVDIESTTYHEGLAGAFLHEFLTAQKYSVERMPVEQPDHSTPGSGNSEDQRFNVYAALPGITPDVVLSTHMDTVPPFFGCTEDDLYLYGRGSCDAKGIIAAQVAAADRLREAGVKVGLLFVVGEERDSAGAKVANENPRGSRFLINGEPTDNRLALATKGACASNSAPKAAWRTPPTPSSANPPSTSSSPRSTTSSPCRCRSSPISDRMATPP